MIPANATMPLREDPSDITFAVGMNDSITEQGRRVSIGTDTNGNLVITPDPNGSGLILPYIGNGSPNAPVGVAITPGQGTT